jgi:Caspase domain
VTLIPDSVSPGLWRALPAGSAGAHALIIGISDYPHVDGGSGPLAPQTARMGQLEVSALTAVRIFRWLEGRSSVAGAPLASCRLLLAPRPDEQVEVKKLTGGHYAEPLLGTMRAAAEGWRDDLWAGGQSGSANVAFFFFSGHGLDHRMSPSLLAKDILNPWTPAGPDNAAAFRPLVDAVASYGVDRAVFFVDACRNAPELAKRFNIKGQVLLAPVVDLGRNPDAVVWLQATARGGYAYQSPGDPGTIFGQALLEGLEGSWPDFRPYDCSRTPYRLIFGELDAYTKDRVRALLDRHSVADPMPVQASGEPYEAKMLVAEMSPLDIVCGGGPPRSPTAPLRRILTSAVDTVIDRVARSGRLLDLPGLTPVHNLLARAAVDAATTDLVSNLSASILEKFQEISAPYLETVRARGGEQSQPSSGDLGNYELMHEVLGHESIAGPWVGSLRLLDLDTASPADPDAMRVRNARTREAEGLRMAWLDLTVAPGAGKALWLKVAAEYGGSSAAAVIPRDFQPIPVRLDLVYAKDADHSGWSLQSMTTRLASPDGLPDEAQRVWQPLWEVQRIEAAADLARAGKAADRLRVLERALRRKEGSPVAAAIGAALLLRAGAIKRLADWPKNLSDWFPWLPDGPILWAETLLRRTGSAQSRRDQQGSPETQRYFLEIGLRGVPLLAPVLALAVGQAAAWRQLLAGETEAGNPPTQLLAACDAVEAAADFAQPDGLFGTFWSCEAELEPSTIFGTTRSAIAHRAGAPAAAAVLAME